MAILLVGIVALTRAFLRGDVTPGWVYRQEREARERAEAREALLLKALPVLTGIAANGGSPGASDAK